MSVLQYEKRMYGKRIHIPPIPGDPGCLLHSMERECMERDLITLDRVQIKDAFWDKYTKLVIDQVLPYQWKVLNDQVEGIEPSHAIRNFRIAAGKESGDFYGFVFQDSDVAKWLEAAAYSLAWHRDDSLEEKMDGVIELLGEAMRPDGYLDTYFIIRDPGHEFTNLRDGHELYCAGHLIEAGVAYYRVTGKRNLLDICIKMADHIVESFHSQDLERAIPGHEEIELALVRLYEVTDNRAYLEMAKEFIDRRGQEPHYFFEEKKRPHYKQIFPEHDADGYHLDYAQTDVPVREQKRAEGHAVRAVYLYCAMADVAYYTQDQELFAACERLYENITRRQMYITGGIGSSGFLERFTTDYDLPNAMNYSESCASIGLALFCRRMARITGQARYMDTAECALYNTVLAGIAMDGKSFFYVNPLAVWPQVCMPGTSRSHVKPVRQGWFACACCPPNIARTLASLGEYCFFTDKKGFYVNLYVSGEAELAIGGDTFNVSIQTRFPFEGHVRLTLRSVSDKTPADDTNLNAGKSCADAGCIRLRIPEYVDSFRILVNSQEQSPKVREGYAVLEGPFLDGDVIDLEMEMEPVFYSANPSVRADAGRVALKMGPLVYCLEQEDNGENLEQLLVDPKATVRKVWREDLLKGTMTLETEGYRAVFHCEDQDALYAKGEWTYEKQTLRFVPYAYWDNRSCGEMIVWVRAKQD